jgi:hypothetical protein
VPFERGEHDSALVRFMAVVKQVTGHRPSLRRSALRDIRATP